jgi:hypothetical protein
MTIVECSWVRGWGIFEGWVTPSLPHSIDNYNHVNHW